MNRLQLVVHAIRIKVQTQRIKKGKVLAKKLNVFDGAKNSSDKNEYHNGKIIGIACKSEITPIIKIIRVY